MVELEEKKEYLKTVYNLAVLRGLCGTQKEFAQLLGIDKSGLSMAMNGSERHLTPSLIGKVEMFATANGLDDSPEMEETESSVLVIPYEARGGTIGDFVEGVHEYDCEKITSPIRGADYAMEVTGDSMAPEYPSGSRVLIKKVDETAFIQWNETYVLDTPNGAVIKRVRKTDDPKLVECVSVNPAYQSYTVPRDFIRGWYRVLMVMALK
jgi:phage repressor protein C with HTH and peptisase S24 domain